MKIDVANLHKVSPEHGLSHEEITAEHSKIPDFLAKIHARKQGFYNIVDNPTDKIKEFAATNKNRYEHFVILGIGGSALGAICLQQSLTHLFKTPKLYVLDNIDPVMIRELEDVIDYEKTLFIVITKSGTTPETLSQYFYFKQKAKHFVFITDPEKGDLRKIANEENIPAFDIPSDVGGRFSVLTAVGLLPAALLGFDIDKLLAGARTQRDKFFSADGNPAFTLAAIQYLLSQKGKIITVMMPYAQKLIRLADWYRQLLAESIGKDGKGLTPVNALGVTDQHSQSQLYNEGPNDKLIIFIEVENLGPETADFNKLLRIEKQATSESLTQNNRPNITITIPQIDEENLGELFMFFESSIAFLGEFFGVNAFDQPGVELSKQLTKKLLS